MGNRVATSTAPTQTPTETPTMGSHSESRTTTPKRKVKVGVMCFDFIPCKHFVQLEGFPGWAVYDAKQIAQRFVRNPDAFEFDSKFIPELDIQRPDAKHFEPYIHDKMEEIKPELVLEIHSKKKAYHGDMN